MKSQPTHVMVQTPLGAKRLDSLVANEHVYGEDGKIYSVVSNIPLGIKPVYKIFFNDDSAIECNEDTDLSCYVGNRLTSIPSSTITKEFKSMKSLKFGLTKPVERMAKNLLIPTDIMGILLHEDSKMVYTDNEVILVVTTKQLERVTSYFEDSSCGYFGGHAKHTTINSPTLIQYLKQYNTIKSPEYRVIPDMYLRGSVEQRVELLNSLMKFNTINCSYQPMLSSLRELVESLGYSSNTKHVMGEYRGYWLLNVTTTSRSIVKAYYMYNAYSSELITTNPTGLYLTNNHIII